MNFFLEKRGEAEIMCSATLRTCRCITIKGKYEANELYTQVKPAI